MTTIVYSKGVLACDSLVTADAQKLAWVKKSMETPSYLAAYCGELAYMDDLFKWVASGFRRNKPKDIPADAVFELVVITKRTGRVSIVESRLQRVTLDNDEYCAGSGAQYAWGALAMGATAEEAVAVAAKFDGATGGTIICLNV